MPGSPSECALHSKPTAAWRPLSRVLWQSLQEGCASVSPVDRRPEVLACLKFGMGARPPSAPAHLPISAKIWSTSEQAAPRHLDGAAGDPRPPARPRREASSWSTHRDPRAGAWRERGARSSRCSRAPRAVSAGRGATRSLSGPRAVWRARSQVRKASQEREGPGSLPREEPVSNALEQHTGGQCRACGHEQGTVDSSIGMTKAGFPSHWRMDCGEQDDDLDAHTSMDSAHKYWP